MPPPSHAVRCALAAAVVAAATGTMGGQTTATSAPPSRDAAAVAEADEGWWAESQKTRDERLGWWRDARFGCFIHWGPYAVAGGEWNGHSVGGYAEHMMRSQKVPLAVYKQKVVGAFDPEMFDADEWVRLIKDAGMGYLVITAKHHDGFAMWPSDAYKYDIRHDTRFRRDPMAELAAACRRKGIRFGFYYSHAFDWEHPDAPGNDWDYQNPGGDKGLFGGADWYDAHPELLPRIRRYVDGKAIPQLRELVARYQPDVFWFDTSGKLPLSEQLRVVKAVREAAPRVVINGRAARGLGRNFGDYTNTGDRPAELRPTAGDWESIPTTNESYGYHKLDNSHKPPAYFIQLLAKAAAKGGNVLLNVGPMGDGRIDVKDQEILRGIGRWMAVNGESIRETARTPLARQVWGESTVKGQTVYLHVFDWPADGRLVVGGLHGAASSACLLSDPSKAPLPTERLSDDDLVVLLPGRAPDAVDSVVVLSMKGEIRADPRRRLATRAAVNRLLAFDADAHGKLGYGDGKALRYYVNGWSNADHWLAWPIRLNEPATFEVAVRYNRSCDACGGSYSVRLGDKVLEVNVEPGRSDPREMLTSEAGRVRLPAGEHEIRIQPLKVQGGDLMNLFEIDLRAVD